MPVDYGNPATYKVRHNRNNDSRAFIAACEAFSLERKPVCRPSIRVRQVYLPPKLLPVASGLDYNTQALDKSESMKREINGGISGRAGSGNGWDNGADISDVRTHHV